MRPQRSLWSPLIGNFYFWSPKTNCYSVIISFFLVILNLVRQKPHLSRLFRLNLIFGLFFGLGLLFFILGLVWITKKEGQVSSHSSKKKYLGRVLVDLLCFGPMWHLEWHRIFSLPFRAASIVKRESDKTSTPPTRAGSFGSSLVHVADDATRSQYKANQRGTADI